MTSEERLAAIEGLLMLVSSSGPRGPWCESSVCHDDVRWLIAEVRRLQSEYARGREELAEFCKDRASKLMAVHDSIRDPLSKVRVESAVEVYRHVISVIERGEHVENGGAGEKGDS